MDKRPQLSPERCCQQELIEMDADFDTLSELLGPVLLFLCAGVLLCLAVAGLIWAGFKLFT